MITQTPPTGASEKRSDLRTIGAVATATGVSERTLRYYEELGILRPTAHRPGGGRLYADDDVDRVRRIRELQGLMGFNLEEIRTVLSAEDRLDVLRGEYRAGTRNPIAVVEEAIATLESLRAQVDAKLEGLAKFRAGLDERLERLRPRLGSSRPGDSGPSTAVPVAKGQKERATSATTRAAAKKARPAAGRTPRAPRQTG